MFLRLIESHHLFHNVLSFTKGKQIKRICSLNIFLLLLLIERRFFFLSAQFDCNFPCGEIDGWWNIKDVSSRSPYTPMSPKNVVVKNYMLIHLSRFCCTGRKTLLLSKWLLHSSMLQNGKYERYACVSVYTKVLHNVQALTKWAKL